MRGRLTAGQLPLEQFILVRIQAPQQYKSIMQFTKK